MSMNNLHAGGELPDNFPVPLRTLVVDDSTVFLESLCLYLKSNPLFEVFATAADGSEALRMALIHKPDLVLMDLNMPVMDGLKTTVVLRQCMPNLRIIIMTLEDTAESKARAHGAHGFICKQAIMNDLILKTEVRRAFHPTHPKNRSR